MCSRICINIEKYLNTIECEKKTFYCCHGIDLESC